MKATTILFAIMLASAFTANAQTVGLSVVPSGKNEITTVEFNAPADRHFVIFEAVLPARSAAECFASRNFSSAVPVGPERASTVYDPTTGFFYLRNSNAAESSDSCRVIIARSTVGLDDLTMWRARYGSTSARSADENQTGKEGSIEADAPSTQRSRVTSVRVTFSTIAN